MTTRRPRVPRSSQRQLADVGVNAGHRTGTYGTAGGTRHDASGASATSPDDASTHPVGGYSAKVIPLDAAPSRHAVAPAGTLADDTGPAAKQRDRQPPAPSPEATSEPAPEATDGLPAPSTTAAAPGPAPEQRRAAERGKLLRRSTRRAPRRPMSPSARAAARDAALGTAGSSVSGTAGPPVSGAARGQAGGAHRPAPSGAVPVKPVPARNFTGRSVAFLIVLFIAAVLLAPTLRVFLDQQAELRAVQEDISAERELQQELTDEISRWEDPAYIQQQARERFNLVMPGERTYMVIGGDEAVEDPVPPPASPSEVNPDMPWADALWDSVVRAGTD